MIHQEISRNNLNIPNYNIDVVDGQGVFTCRTSERYATFRTIINGTREDSAIQAAAALQKWVESGPVVRVEWYLVGISPNCPVSIGSLTEEECIDQMDV